MITIPKWPVVIFASPRTGSTAFSQYLVDQKLGSIFFNEPAWYGGVAIGKFAQAFNSQNYVVKVMGDQLKLPDWPCPQYPPYRLERMFSDEFYKIK